MQREADPFARSSYPSHQNYKEKKAHKQNTDKYKEVSN